MENTYLIKALDAYPYNLEECVEALSYALSYDPNNGQALCLKGRLYIEVYQDYTGAISCFEKALEDNLNMHHIYGFYALALLCAEEYDKAETFLDFALTVQGSDKALLLARKAAIYECKQEFKKAKKTIRKAKIHAYNDGFMCHLQDVDARLDKKIKLTKPTKKEKKGKKK